MVLNKMDTPLQLMWAWNGGFSLGDELSLTSSYLALISATVSTPEKLLHGLHSMCAGVDAQTRLLQKPCSGQHQAATVQVRHWTAHREITIKEYIFFLIVYISKLEITKEIF